MKSTIQKCAGCGSPVAATFQLSHTPSGRAYVCQSCRHWHLGFATTPKVCHACGHAELQEKELDRALCPTCTRKLEEGDEVVRKGGIYWSCSGCCSEGVLNPGHPLAVKLRAAYHVQPPDPLILNLEKCPHCPESRVDTTAN